LSADNKIHPLHYLRGLAALGIMFYHYFAYPFEDMGITDGFLGKVGIYGVSIFYVLSGLTLYHVYKDRIGSWKELGSYGIKRFFRIFPLFWMALICTLIIHPQLFDLPILFGNLSGLFGFFAPDSAIPYGGWAIGVEIIFYLLFPLALLIMRKNEVFGVTAITALFVVGILYSSFLIDPNKPFDEQWPVYVNPLNHIYLFLGGMLLGYVRDWITINRLVSMIGLGIGIAGFLLYPVGDDLSNIAYGGGRILFSSLCFLICFSLYRWNFKLHGISHRFLFALGSASYSLYLLHPIVYDALMKVEAKFFPEFSASLLVLIASVVSIIWSIINYQIFEKFFLKSGKKLADKLLL
jgi:exopolysaccharide production protein ExoZ